VPIPKGVMETSRWLVAELLIVTLGVLIALWVDGLREDARARDSEAEVLNALLVEFESNQGSIRQRRDMYSRRGAAQLELAKIGRGSAPPTADSLDVLWRWAIRTGEANPTRGVLNSTTTSGALSLISNPIVRHRIAGMPDDWDGIQELERRHNRIILDYLRPWLRSRGSLPGGVGAVDFPLPSLGVHLPMASDVELQQLLIEAGGYWRAIDQAYASLADDIEETVGLIEGGN
jgi:hypothetical protein